MDDEEKKMKLLWKEKQESGGSSKVDFLYNDKVDSEDFLLGKRIDRVFEEQNFSQKKESGIGSIFDDEAVKHNQKMESEIKARDDPLFEIRRKEEDARRALLNNPMKMKQLEKALKSKKQRSSGDELLAKYMALKGQKTKDKPKKEKKKLPDDERSLLQRYLELIGKARQYVFYKDSSDEEDQQVQNLQDRHQQRDSDHRPFKGHHDLRHQSPDRRESRGDHRDRGDRFDRIPQRESGHRDTRRYNHSPDHRPKSRSRSPRRYRQPTQYDRKQLTSPRKDRSNRDYSRREGDEKDSMSNRKRSSSPRKRTYSPKKHSEERRGRTRPESSSRRRDDRDRDGRHDDVRSGKPQDAKRDKSNTDNDDHSGSGGSSGTGSDSESGGDSASSGCSLPDKKTPKPSYGLLHPKGRDVLEAKANMDAKRAETRKKDVIQNSPATSSAPIANHKRKRLTSAEREAKLAEMRDDAEWREETRKSNVERYAQEEELEEKSTETNRKSSTDFMNPIMSQHADETSVEEQIRRNKHKIQRSKTESNSYRK